MRKPALKLTTVLFLILLIFTYSSVVGFTLLETLNFGGEGEVLYLTQEEPCDFVIIANETFYEYDGEWDLQRLADWHNGNDTITAMVVNLSEIYLNETFWVNGTWGDGNPANPFNRSDEPAITNYPMFNDSQAQIRNYLRYAYTNLSTRYALFVGDADDADPLFPIRECYASGDGAPLIQARQYELIPTDMYYACLNGTMNSDEDINSEAAHSGFGENVTECNISIEELDWDYEIAVGRFPVDDTTELSNIVKKTVTYMSLDTTEEYLWNITLAGFGGGFGGITEWQCNYSKVLNNTAYNHWKDNSVTVGFNHNFWNILVMDANPEREEGITYYDTDSHGVYNSGTHIIYQGSHGSTSGWSDANEGEANDFTTSDITELTNTNYCFVMSSMPCSTAKFDESDDPFSEVFVTDEYGAFAYIGNTRYGYGSYGVDGLNSSSHLLGCETIDAWLNESYTRIGDMHLDAKRDSRRWHDVSGDQALRYTMYEQILFGSPAVRLHTPTQETIEFDAIEGGENETTVYTSTPAFSWNIIADVVYYQLQISDTPTFETILVNLSNVSEARYPAEYSENSTHVSFILPSEYKLVDSKQYYCRVRHTVGS